MTYANAPDSGPDSYALRSLAYGSGPIGAILSRGISARRNQAGGPFRRAAERRTDCPGAARPELIVKRAMGMAQIEVMGNAAQVLCRPHKKISARRQRFGHPGHNRPPRFGRKVHERVAEENRVVGSRLPERGLWVYQVSLVQRNHLADRVDELKTASFGTKTAFLKLRLRFRAATMQNNGPPCLSQSPHVHVDPVYGCLPARQSVRPCINIASVYGSSPEAQPAERMLSCLADLFARTRSGSTTS